MPRFLGKRKRRSYSAPQYNKRQRMGRNSEWKVTRRRARPPRQSLVGAPVNRACYFEAECVCRQFDMERVGLLGDNFVTINRYDYGGIYPAVGSSIGIDNCPRFNDLRAGFREFAITGVKIEITPNDRENVAVNG